MKRWLRRALLTGIVCCLLGASSCYSSYSVGYGYTGDYYGDAFYTRPVDRYGFYGHP